MKLLIFISCIFIFVSCNNINENNLNGYNDINKIEGVINEIIINEQYRSKVVIINNLPLEVNNNTFLNSMDALTIGMPIVGFYRINASNLDYYSPLMHALVISQKSQNTNVLMNQFDRTWLYANDKFWGGNIISYQPFEDTKIIYQTGTVFNGTVDDLTNFLLLVEFDAISLLWSDPPRAIINKIVIIDY